MRRGPEIWEFEFESGRDDTSQAGRDKTLTAGDAVAARPGKCGLVEVMDHTAR